MLRLGSRKQGLEMMRFVGWASVVMLLGACSAGSKAAAPQYDEECTMATGCAMGLTCVMTVGALNGQCTLPCTATAQCQAVSTKSVCIVSEGYCYDPCIDKINCTNGLNCTMAASMQGTCRR
jgi:hypothetical protein